MKSKLIVDFLFILIVSVMSSVLTYELYVKDAVQNEMPKVAVISLDSEVKKLGVELSNADYKQLATQLKVKADELSEQGYLVIDDASVIAASDRYKAN